jgi:hypothetical protein
MAGPSPCGPQSRSPCGSNGATPLASSSVAARDTRGGGPPPTTAGCCTNEETRGDNEAVQASVQKYYGEVLKSSSDLKTSACCTPNAPPKYVLDALKKVRICTGLFDSIGDIGVCNGVAEAGCCYNHHGTTCMSFVHGRSSNLRRVESNQCAVQQHCNLAPFFGMEVVGGEGFVRSFM